MIDTYTRAIPFNILLVEIRISAVNKAIIKPNTNVTSVIGIEYFTNPSNIGPNACFAASKA